MLLKTIRRRLGLTLLEIFQKYPCSSLKPVTILNYISLSTTKFYTTTRTMKKKIFK